MISGDDPEAGLSMVARAVTRGDGKTEGYHERHVPLAKKAAGIFARDRNEVASLAQARVAALGELRGALNFALKLLSQGGPDSVADKDTTKNFVRPGSIGWSGRPSGISSRTCGNEVACGKPRADSPGLAEKAAPAWPRSL